MNTATAKESAKPLRILILLNLKWDARLGAARVYMALADEWRAAGHSVEHYSLSDAFPRATGSSPGFALRQMLFASKAKAFVRKNAARFDIIDAHIGSLSASKQTLGFGGLLVARSVGLYLLYDGFEKSAHQRWPHRSRGRFLGRILYSLTRRRLLRASDLAVRHADVINVPNQEEADYLRREIVVVRPIVVQPYGLTEDRRGSLHHAASDSATRLAKKKISFVGMWSERKGAHDWPHIIRRIRKEIPEARFCLLGTMVETPAILRELGSKGNDGIELISEYSPEDLPRLLADCALGIFPSYVEGFGLAVLEQLAAGIPTVAYDTSGPHDILSSGLSDLLVPVGDSEALAQAACKILRLQASDYERLSERSSETAARFSWSKIARDTLDAYRQRLKAIAAGPVLFVQPFSLGSAGGGARILRALLGNAPMEWLSLCSSPESPNPWPGESHIPTRPSWGKIERSRLAMFPRKTMSIFAPGFRRDLKAFCRQAKVSAIHAIPHTGLDFHQAHRIAREMGLPFFLQVHDDFAYSSRGHVDPKEAHAAMQSAWSEAEARFVISEQLGDEYSRRYGARKYVAITDGVETVAASSGVRSEGELRIYFMGLFHLEYEENLRVLCSACEQLRKANKLPRLSITLRCGTLRPGASTTARDLIHVRPFSTEADVHRDLDQADLLYLPLPFGAEFEPLVRFSLSTKLITYLGSGRPILYHGPRNSAVYELLAQHEAAFICSSLEVNDMMETLNQVIDQPHRAMQISSKARALARERFMLKDQRARFWNVITTSSNQMEVA